MAFDAPRKTLDDIRRELDAEYGASAILDEQAARAGTEDAAPRDTAPRDAPMDPEEEATIALLRERRPGGWGGYVVAGLVGCIAGQILLLAALVALHYSSGSAVRASTPPTSEAPAERATPSASVTSPPPVAAEPRDAAPVPELTVMVPPATQFVPPTTAPASKTGEPRASVAAMTTAQPATTTDEAKPAPRRSTRQTPAASAAAPPAAPRAKAAPTAPSAKAPATFGPDSQDWARSQDEVRVALRAWLARSHQDADVRASDTVVILGADGRTAKSHVRMRTAGGIVVHEQRWTREANGWSLVENREAWRSDPAR
jgi:hypothetical protein